MADQLVWFLGSWKLGSKLQHAPKQLAFIFHFDLHKSGMVLALSFKSTIPYSLSL